MKKWMLILLAAVLALLLTGCGSKPAETPAATEAPVATEAPADTEAPAEQATEAPAADPAETAGKTLQELVEAVVKDAADLAPFSADELTDMAGIEPEDYTDFAFFQGSDVMEGREILVLRARDDAVAEKLAGQMEKYLERRREENQNYAPKAYQALTAARVERKGLLLVMISGGEAEAETAALLAGE